MARTRDPALLEFIGFHLIRSSVFPVEPHGTQKIRLTYEHVLRRDGDRIDYVLPRSESLEYAVPWHIRVTVKSQRKFASVYSPSHGIDTRITQPGRTVDVRLSAGAEREPGSFRLSLLWAGESGPSATLLAYPDPQVGGGYFLLLCRRAARADLRAAADPARGDTRPGPFGLDGGQQARPGPGSRPADPRRA